MFVNLLEFKFDLRIPKNFLFEFFLHQILWILYQTKIINNLSFFFFVFSIF